MQRELSKPIDLLRSRSSTNVCQAEGRDWAARHHVLWPLLTLHGVSTRRPCIITWPIWTKKVMYFHFINFTDTCNTTCIASRGNFAILTNYWRRKSIGYLRNWWHVRKRIKWRKNVTYIGSLWLVSFISLINVLYNSLNQFHIFLFFAVPKNVIFRKISGFHMSLKNW